MSILRRLQNVTKKDFLRFLLVLMFSIISAPFLTALILFSIIGLFSVIGMVYEIIEIIYDLYRDQNIYFDPLVTFLILATVSCLGFIFIYKIGDWACNIFLRLEEEYGVKEGAENKEV